MKKHDIPITKTQEYLLKAIAGNPSESIDWYRRWVDSVNFEDNIDGPSYGLLPALYKRLESLGFRDGNSEKLRGVYQRSLYKNSLLLHHLCVIGKELNDRGIPFMVLKGTPLLLHYLANRGQRSMNDLDILVAAADINAAIEILVKNGFNSDCNYDIQENINIRHSYSFRNGKGMEIDLHCRSLAYAYEEICFEKTRLITYNGINMNMMLPESFILHICMHALNKELAFNLNWIHDLNIIMKNEPLIDWHLMVDGMHDSRMAYVIYLLFDYFNGISDIKIPAGIIVQLKELGSNKACMKHAARVLERSDTLRGKINWYGYSLHYKDKGFFARILYYPHYRLMISKYDSYNQMLKAFVRKYILRKRSG
ncbi:MAG: nucleotidyltransferase family protein [Clostridia bacterium]|nr:nucleotidyltransferase family protein [Clostridia bacterium]